MAVAGISPPNPASEALHAAHGFTPVGTFDGRGDEVREAVERALVPAPAQRRRRFLA